MRRRRLRQRSSAAECVEHGEMRRGIEQCLMFVLAVQLDEARRQILQRAGRRQLAVDEGAAATLRGDFAAHQQLLPAALENASIDGGVFARPDQVAGGAAAQQQTDRFDENGFAGPGFAGEDVQAGLELDLDRVDDRQPPDREGTGASKRRELQS